MKENIEEAFIDYVSFGIDIAYACNFLFLLECQIVFCLGRIFILTRVNGISLKNLLIFYIKLMNEFSILICNTCA